MPLTSSEVFEAQALRRLGTCWEESPGLDRLSWTQLRGKVTDTSLPSARHRKGRSPK